VQVRIIAKKLKQTVGSCRINRLLFADDLVPLASPENSFQTYIWSLCSCVRPNGNRNQYEKDRGIMSFHKPKPAYAANKRKHTAAGGGVWAPWALWWYTRGRKTVQRAWYTDWWSKHSSEWAVSFCGDETGVFKHSKVVSF